MSKSTKQQPDASATLNVKQLSRIQKRRLARQKLNAALSLNKERKKMHSQSLPYPDHLISNHGCMLRSRGPDGRFLTLDQIVTRHMGTLTIREAGVKESSKEKPKA